MLYIMCKWDIEDEWDTGTYGSELWKNFKWIINIKHIQVNIQVIITTILIGN